MVLDVREKSMTGSPINTMEADVDVHIDMELYASIRPQLCAPECIMQSLT